jgi:dTDP-4-amino-4,6-dideoxy-D-galactose acyltransferase
MPLCKFLEFDSELFGMRLARVEGRLADSQAAAQVKEWCAEQNIKGAYLLADSDDAETAMVAQENGFRFVDERVTLEKSVALQQNLKIRDAKLAVNFRDARPYDVPELETIAAASHTHTRFYFDQRFPREKCGRLYDVWTENSCRTSGLTLVAEVADYIAGYITCDADGRIGLMAVDPKHRMNGIGTELVLRALGWLLYKQIPAAIVATQARNVPALRLYQRCGFQITSVKTWYHLWL